MKGVEKRGDGKLYLSRVATDDGRKVSLVIDPRGCVVTVRVK
ncbi:hypothetical protein [Solimonas soli]|nr:hypothetical protein [Solimonas soli]